MLKKDHKNWSEVLTLKDEDFCSLMGISLKEFLLNKP